MMDDTPKKVMEFLGVHTGGSLSLRFFPNWTQVLGIEGAYLRGVDLPLDGSLDAHHKAIECIKHDPNIYGALVTSHKLSVVRAAGQLIDCYTDTATLTGEVSALYKREGQLWGHAVDPQNCGYAMDHFLPANWWVENNTSGILALGGGGATIALLVNLLKQASHCPAFIKIVEKRRDNLNHCAQLVEQLNPQNTSVELIHCHDPMVCDQMISELPSHSMVINATGMGKDIPGSPVTNAESFPMNGIVWELNYRGDRPFLRQAMDQSIAKNLIVADGWYYFLRGWSSVIGLVFDIPITDVRFRDFCAVTHQE